ncbi:DUF1203 domain-containing protein [Maritalea mediterranea]|uniref:DUF1203 domain-containing protein n=1 Tax=Maritalea mediterranea TaxID=2909667 RepID=A0ABS9E974_9HYPH|nr:DUF1203 domain-containing protein [Maritalea mediterranea]MCF4099439.1 DUF1203 domain-containing protein [Maritalea mediterranea]
MSIKFTAIPTEIADGWRNGGTDAHGQKPEHRISDGGAPCRHCLKNIPEGKGVLLGAYKPFQSIGAFAEIGPIFICEDDCQRFESENGKLPPVIAEREQFLIRGYSADEKIDYRTGQIVKVNELPAHAEQIFALQEVAFIHIRSAAYSCFTARIDRTD